MVNLANLIAIKEELRSLGFGVLFLVLSVYTGIVFVALMH